MSIKRELGTIRKECVNKHSLYGLSESVAMKMASLSIEEILSSVQELKDNKHLVEKDSHCEGYTRALINIMECFVRRLSAVERCHYSEGTGYPDNRCFHPDGHEGDHKLSRSTSYINAKMTMYWECGGCSKDIGSKPGSCPYCGYVTAFYKRELQKFKIVETE